MVLKKNIKVGKIKFYTLIIVFFLVFLTNSYSENNLEGNFTDIKILDKISSKNELIKIVNGEEINYKDLLIKSIKCNYNELVLIKSKKKEQIDEIDFPVIGSETTNLLLAKKFKLICLFNNQ